MKYLEPELYIKQDLRILDLGCGAGFTSVRLSQIFTGAEITAVNPSPSITKTCGHCKGHACSRDLHSLRFPQAHYDAVIIIGNLMPHNNSERTLREVRRILKPDGLLILDFKNCRSTLRLAMASIARIGLSDIIPDTLFQ